MLRRLTRSTLLWGVLWACSAHAGSETQWWRTETANDLARAESRGVVVDAEGILRTGPRADSWPTDSLGVAWCATRLTDGSIAVGGDRGCVMRWSAGRGWSLWARLGTGQVLALAADGDGAVAGTGPGGAVFRIGARGDTTRLLDTGERYVWGIVPAGRGAWWLATGSRGRLLRLESGRVRTVFDSEESHLVAMTPDGAGGVYLGGDSKGRIYHVDAQGLASTLFDTPEDEVRALARDADGVLWAAALTSSADTETDDGPTPASSGSGRATIYRIGREGDAVAWWSVPQPLVYAMLARSDGPWLATGSRAGVHRIEGPQRGSLLLAPPQGQVSALVADGDAVVAVTSNPVVLWRLGPGAAARGELSSPVKDTRRRSRFGRLVTESLGAVGFATRSGNSDTPDTTWSRWEAVGADGRVSSPDGRFVQWRATLGPGSRVDEVALSWRERNLPPRVEALSVAPQGRDFREGEKSGRSEAVTQTLPNGQKVEYSTTTSGARALQELPVWARGLRTLTWRGVDPNGDELRYRVEVRREPDGAWIPIAEDLEVSLLTWDTNTLPDGRHRLRVTVDDREGVALGEGLSGEAMSEAFTIDNTPPRIESLEAVAVPGGVRVTATASDATGRLQRLDLSWDDAAWREVSPEGGITDASRHTVRHILTTLEPGTHLVSLRAVDAAGNASTSAVQVTVPRSR